MDRPKPSPAHHPAANAAPGHELAPDVVARIEEVFAALDDLDHYRLLGIPRNATRAQVRTAFLRAAPMFHPDRYFGKRLGELGPKMQKVFARFTLAHDTLVADERRIKYDATLLPETKPPPPPPSREPETPPPLQAQSATVPVAQPSPKRGSGSISVTADAANRARRDAFAARLSGRHSSTQVGRPSSAQIRAATASAGTTPPQPTRPSSPEAAKVATDALRRRYEEQVLGAKERHLSAHVQQAQAAVGKGDFEAAASHYREAMALSSDPAIKAGYDDAVARSKRVVSDASLDQARDYESQKQWAEAA